MPDWLSQLGFGAILAIIGWLIVNKLNGIDKKLDRYEERQAKVEKDCVTWDDLNKELGPIKRKTDAHEVELATLKATCKAEHGK